MYYKFNKKTLMFEKNLKGLLIKVGVLILSVSLFSFYYGFNIANGIEKSISYFKYEPPVDLRQEWIDSVFTDYNKRATIYLSRDIFENSPIKPYMLTSAAKDQYLATGVFLPVELALAQAKIESSMGTKGRSPKTNPFNIGEYDSQTAMRFKNTYEGIKAYYRFMTNNYLKCKNVDELLKQFTNCNHLRYASANGYEDKIAKEINHIRRYIDKNMFNEYIANN